MRGEHTTKLRANSSGKFKWESSSVMSERNHKLNKLREATSATENQIQHEYDQYDELMWSCPRGCKCTGAELQRRH